MLFDINCIFLPIRISVSVNISNDIRMDILCLLLYTFTFATAFISVLGPFVIGNRPRFDNLSFPALPLYKDGWMDGFEIV